MNIIIMPLYTDVILVPALCGIYSQFICVSVYMCFVHVVVCLHVFYTCCFIQLTYVTFLFSSTHLQSECQKILQDLAKIAILADLTLILAWRWVLLLGT